MTRRQAAAEPKPAPAAPRKRTRKPVPKRPRPTGRPTLLDNDREGRALEAILRGATDAQAAFAAGVHRDTLSDWKARGEAADDLEATGAPVPDDEVRYLRFFRGYTAARYAYLEALELTVHAGAREDPKLALEVLARRNPEKWGRRGTVTLEAPPGSVLPIFAPVVPGGPFAPAAGEPAA